MATELQNLQDLRHTASLATKVFIQRDYSEGTVCKFHTKLPAELNSRIERNLFEDTVKTLNNYYAEAEKISGQSYLEGCLACVSAYIIFLCMETRYEKEMTVSPVDHQTCLAVLSLCLSSVPMVWSRTFHADHQQLITGL
ncbi:golgin subfamily A member 7B isoform X2 [Pangasianodon hypophthalmus]|uniref:golgin subfamily A member 7B isoform X2 n=1 Tax=Pangasianodon hypophthalmus TaxID=310915 RepID=UPI000F0041D0|nr:golgin subfamily A member 7B isoform X2 [Pangasianodon hypophthalmus]